MKQTDGKTKAPGDRGEISGKLFEGVFLPWTAILILSHLLTMYIAPAHTWGVHFYHFFPAWIGWALTLVTLAILIPGVGEFLYEKSEFFGERIKRPFAQLSPNKTFLILGLFSLPIFWIFRPRLHLLGDGYIRMRELSVGKLHLPEWLDGFIHLGVYRMMTKVIPTWTPELTYSSISILCGGVFVFLSLKLSSLLGKDGFQKTLLFFFLVSLGSIELFFGYVESYSILQVMLLAYIFFAALYLSGKTSIFPAFLALVISLGLHITCLIFLPSFIYLLWRGQRRSGTDKISSSLKDVMTSHSSSKMKKVRSPKESSKSKHVLTVPLLIALILFSAVIVFYIYTVVTALEKTGKGMLILPLIPTESYPFSMLSLAHISEFVNQLLLLSPVGISLIMFFLFFKIKFKEFEDKLANFLILAVSFALVYLFVFNFTLGSADWDLRSSPAPFFGLLGVLLFLRWGEDRSAVRRPSTSLRTSPPSADPKSQMPVGKRFKAWGLIFIWFSLFHTVPWVLINAHQSKSVARYVLIQENDPHPVDEANYNLYKIARILGWAGLPEEVENMYQRAIDKNPHDTLSYYNLAVVYYNEEKSDQAICYLDSVLKIYPFFIKANGLISEIYMKREDFSKALVHMERCLPILADSIKFLYDLALVNFRVGEIDQSLTYVRRIISLNPDYGKAYRLSGYIYMIKQDYSKAKEAWEDALLFFPGDSVALHYLDELENVMKKRR